MKKFAVIVAGGTGSRMESAIPKQFLPLKGKPLLLYTVEQFLNAYPDCHLVVVIGAGYRKQAEDLFAPLGQTASIQLVSGGETRFHSVKNGLAKVPDDSIVFVHDGVRCLVTTSLIHRCYETALQKGNATPVIMATDSMRIERNGDNEVIDRSLVRLIQTPQTFQARLIKKAFEQEFDVSFTDEATVLEKLGHKIHLVPGEETNLKITRPLDLLLAEKILDSREKS